VSCGLQDILELEQLGTPAVLVASEAFEGAAAQQARLLGQPALARVLVSHTVQDRTDDEIRAFARSALQELLAAVSPASG